MGFLKHRSLLKLNLKFFLDYEFLRDGRYTNVASGETAPDGSDMSVLLCDTSNDDYLANFADGQVWQSPFRNWVYESGIVLNQDIGIRDLVLPKVASGVYIGGTFKATSSAHESYDAAYSHHIDWINGRIIFDNALAPDESVTMAGFSYKHIRFDFEDAFNRELREGYLESEYATNPLTSHNLIYPSGGLQPFPVVFIETRGRKWKPFEMGNRSLIAKDRIVNHVWTNNSMDRDDIVDIISYQDHKSLPLVDFNFAPLPLSGILNELSPSYIPYQNLLKNPTLSGIVGTLNGTATAVGYVCYIVETEIINDPPFQQFERARVEFVIQTYMYHPTSTLGINTGSYQFKGGNEYF